MSNGGRTRRWIDVLAAGAIGVASAVVLTPLVPAGVATAAGPASDNFASGDYSGGTGWNGTWTESGDNGSATTGKVRIASFALRFEDLDSATISRNVDLSAYSPGAQLSFTLVSQAGDEALSFDFRTGASTFTQLAVSPASPAGTRLTFPLTAAMLRADGTLRISSASGSWDGTSEQVTIDDIVISQLVRNPDLAPGCGIDVVLILDESGSIGDAFDQDVEAATREFVAALNGTGSRLRIVEFSTNAREASILGGGFQLVNDAYATAVESYLTGAANRTSPTSYNPASGDQQYTNWEAGVYQAGLNPGDLVVFMTDGVPNTVGTAGTSTDNNGGGQTASAAASVDEINAIKLAGVHMLAVGVGDASIAANWQLLYTTVEPTGAQLWEGTGPLDMRTVDAIRVATFTALENALRQVVFALCAPSVTLTKVDDAGNPVPNWGFTGKVDVTPTGGGTDQYQWVSPALGVTPDNGTGNDVPQAKTTGPAGQPVLYQWTPNTINDPQPWDSTFTYTETLPTGWTLPTQQACNVERLEADGDYVTTSITPSVSQVGQVVTFVLATVQKGDIVTCTVKNNRPATITITKATVPSPSDGTDFNFTGGLGAFSLDVDANATLPSSRTFTVVPGTYTVTESDPSPEYWKLTGLQCGSIVGQVSTTPNTNTRSVAITVTPGSQVTCTFTNTEVPTPVLNVTKTASPTSFPELTASVTYTVQVSNPNGAANPVTITDEDDLVVLNGAAGVPVELNTPTLPLPYPGGQITANTCDDLDGQTVTTTPLQCTFTVAFTGRNAGDVIVDTVTVKGTDLFGNPVQGSDPATVSVTDVLPDISVTKTANPTAVPESGGDVTYTFVVTNNATEAATITALSDNKFGTLAGDGDCQLGTTLAAGGGSCSFAATFAVPPGDHPGSHVNVFTATASDNDGNSDIATEDATVTYTDVLPDISVTKTANPTAVPESGGNVTYTYVVTNNATEAATITALSDNKFGTLAGDADCQLGTVLAAGASCNFAATFAVPAGDHPGTHVNVFTATAADNDGNSDTATDDATVTYTDVLPDISVTKTANPTAVPESGGNVTYTYVVTNNATEAATITALSDNKFGTLSGDGDCQLGTVLAAGASCNFAATFTVPAGDAPGSHVNVFTATAADNDGNSDTATDNETVTYTDVLPDISVTKTANPTAVPESGGNVTYTFVVTNNATEAATITALSDNKFGTLAGDADCQLGTTLAANGGTCSFAATFAVPAGDFPGTHVNVFTATSVDDDGNPSTATDDATVTYTDVLPDISVTKTANPTQVPETGGNVTYTYVVTNNATEAATITALSDDKFGTLSGDGDCQLGTVLAAGASCSFAATFAVPAGDFPGTHVNVFTATAADNDGNSDTASDDATVTYTDVLPDISVTKTANPTQVPETGGNVTYTFVVTNNATEAATITILSDDKFGALAGDGDCQVGSVLAGNGGTCSFDATFAVPAGDFPGTHVNVFTATASDNDGNSDTATDDETVTYTDVLPDISVTKTANPTFVLESGGSINFTYVVTNNSAEAATITALSDDKFGTLAGEADCQLGTVLAGGASCTFTAAFVVPAGDAGTTHVNVFTATVTDSDDNTDTATDDETVTYTDVLPNISVTKTANPTQIPETGGTVTFTYVVTNLATEAVTITDLTDDKFGPLAGNADCQVGTVIAANGGTCSFAATFTVPAGDYPGTHVNVFTATVVDDDENESTASEIEVVTYTDVLPDIAVSKTANPTAIPESGGDVSFTFVVINNSTETADITALSDDKFGTLTGDTDCQVGTVLIAGGSCQFTAVLPVPASEAGAKHVNTFTATVSDDDGNQASDDDDATVDYIDVLPDISVTKTANPTQVPETGGNVVITFVVINNATEAATITALSDNKFGTLAGDADCRVGTVLAAKASCEFAGTFSVPAGDSGGAHVNVFTATVTDNDKNTDTDTDEETVTYTDVLPVVTITKTAAPTQVVEPGGSVAFTFVVTNEAAEAVTLTSLVDTVFGDLDGQGTCATGGTIAGGGTYTCSVTKTVTGNAGLIHRNVVTVTVTDDDENTDEASDDETVRVTDTPSSIRITKTASPTSVPDPGADVTFTFTVENLSAVDAVTISTLTDSVFGNLDGQGTCDVPQLIRAGGSYTCTVTKFIGGTEGETHVNVVTVTGTDDDGNPVSDDDDAEVQIVTPLPADMAIVKTASVQQIGAGGGFNWTLQVTNNGPVATSNVTVGDLVPSPLTVTGATSAQFSCSVSGNRVSCTKASMAVGETGTITISVTVPGDAPGGTVTNVGTVESSRPDPNLTNNSDEESVVVVAQAPPTTTLPPEILPPTGSSSTSPVTSTALVLVLAGAVLLLVRRRSANGQPPTTA